MKYIRIILAVTAVFCMANSLNAQPLAGKFLVGGSSGFDASLFKEKYRSNGDTQDGTSYTSIGLTPMAGYFFTDELVAGIELPISFASEKYDDDDKFLTSTLALAPWARYYFGTGTIVPFIQAEVGVGTSTDKYDPVGGASNTTRSTIFLWELGGGASMFLNDNVALDFGLGYGSVSSKDDDDLRTINSGIGLSIGISVLL